MLYSFDTKSGDLDPLHAVGAHEVAVKEKEIERALARCPTALFRASGVGDPVLIVRTSDPGQRMADIIALDAEGRLVLVECKRGWAARDALAQLLDYASDYASDPFSRLEEDWRRGAGKVDGRPLLDAFREFAEDAGVQAEDIGQQHVLVVVAAARDDSFKKIAAYLHSRGVEVHFAAARLFARGGGELFVEVEPVELRVGDASDVPQAGSSDDHRAWMINTCETWVPGAWNRFLEHGVAAIGGYADGPAVNAPGW